MISITAMSGMTYSVAAKAQGGGIGFSDTVFTQLVPGGAYSDHI
jgi:hypothetical protein